MDSGRDFSVADFGQLTPRLKAGLAFTPQEYAGVTYLHIEDPETGRFYRVGMAEYAFLSCLDGATSIADAVGQTARVMQHDAFHLEEACSIVQWLVGAELLHGIPASSPRSGTGNDARGAAQLSPLFAKVPLFDPDRFLNRLPRWCGWIFSKAALLAGGAICLAAVISLLGNWPRLTRDSSEVLIPANWLWFCGAWLVLKALHEFSHALACQHYGGSVRQVGVAFVLFAPMPYVDVSSSWRFRSRWQRIHTAAAGIMTELVVAAVAALLWSALPVGFAGRLCVYVLLTAGVHTLLFNANPLFRSDGYYILADLLEIPNLSPQSRSYLHAIWMRVVLGLRGGEPHLSGWQGIAIRAYAIASVMWHVITAALLILAAWRLFHGIGLAVALGLGVYSIAPMAIRMLRDARMAWQCGEVHLPHAVVRLAGTGLLLALAIGVRWPDVRTAPGIVEFAPLAVVRSSAPGFVDRICFASGAAVEAGDVLAILRNDDLETELRGLEITLEESRERERMLTLKDELASAQAEHERSLGLQSRLIEKRQQRDSLTLRAPIRGRVLTPRVDALYGSWLETGTEVMSIGDERAKEFRLSISQDDVECFSGRVQQIVPLHLLGRDARAMELAKVNPRASIDPPHPALCAPLGGPLAVRLQKERQQSADVSIETYEFIEPRFQATVAIPPDDAAGLRAGEVGQVSIRGDSITLGSRFYDMVSRWIDERSRPAHRF